MNFAFNPAQAAHAQQVAMELFKKRRFFLPKGAATEKSLPYLSADVFAELYKLEKMFDDKYYFTARNAEVELLKLELDYGLKAPKINGSKQVVTCSRYSGGLEIFAIVPLDPMTEIIDHNIEGFADELFQNWHHNSDAKQMNMRSHFDSYVDTLLEEMNGFFHNESQEKVLVVLGTRFDCAHKDLLSERISGLVSYPHLTSFFLYKLAHNGTRLSPHMSTVFEKLGKHISMDFFPGHARITPNTHNDRYEEKIAFATIL